MKKNKRISSKVKPEAVPDVSSKDIVSGVQLFQYNDDSTRDMTPAQGAGKPKSAGNRRRPSVPPPPFNQFNWWKMLMLIFGISVLIGLALLLALTQSAKQSSNNILKLASNKTIHDDVTAIFLVTNQQKLALQCLSALLSKVQFNRTIVATNQKKLQANLSTFGHVDSLVNSKLQFDSDFINSLLSGVQTQYYFLTTTQWEIQNPQFIQFSKQKLKSDKTIGQILPKIKNQQYSQQKLGFSFLPGVHRQIDYEILQNSVKKTRKNSMKLKDFQKKLSDILKSNKITASVLSQQFVAKQIKQFSKDKILQKQKQRIQESVQNKVTQKQEEIKRPIAKRSSESIQKQKQTTDVIQQQRHTIQQKKKEQRGINISKSNVEVKVNTTTPVPINRTEIKTNTTSQTQKRQVKIPAVTPISATKLEVRVPTQPKLKQEVNIPPPKSEVKTQKLEVKQLIMTPTTTTTSKQQIKKSDIKLPTPMPTPTLTQTPTLTPKPEVKPTPTPTPKPEVKATTPTPKPEIKAPTPKPEVKPLTQTPTPKLEVKAPTKTPIPTPKPEVKAPTPNPKPEIKAPRPTSTPKPEVKATTPTQTPAPKPEVKPTQTSTPKPSTVNSQIKKQASSSTPKMAIQSSAQTPIKSDNKTTFSPAPASQVKPPNK